MIHAIIPIPLRYPMGYTLGVGFRDHGIGLGISGRTVKVLPLYFYKFFSTHGSESYQHIFASDTIIDPITLNKAKNGFNLQPDYYGGVFVPISVKRFDVYGNTTFLFARSINFLLKNYRRNIPLDEVDVLTNGNYSELSPECCGVAGISEFNFTYLSNFMKNNKWFGMTEANRLLMSSMTPELPERISNYVLEIESCQLYGEALANYISDLCTYEQGTAFSMKEFLEGNRYSFPLDPITKLCACTPSYLYGAQLRPFLGNALNLSGYSRIGYNPIDNNLIQSPLNLKFETADPYTWSEEIMEDLINMSDEDFRLTITPECPIMESFSVIGNPAPSIVEHLYQAVLYNLRKYSKIEIVKNWAEEVFMTCWGYDGSCYTYYLNLAWYHLITPSLVNINLVG